MEKFSVISLFSGCGGMDLGFKGGFSFLSKKYKRLPFSIRWACDIEKNACLTFAKNFNEKIFCIDIDELLKEDALFSPVDVVVGGFPCQDFSLAGKRRGLNSQRGNLYLSMVEVIKKTSPKIFVAENVKGILSIDNGKTIEKIISDYKEIGYNVQYNLFKTADFGVPQIRERVIIIGVRNDISEKYKYPISTTHYKNWISIGEAIKDLENVYEGDFINHYWSKAKKNRGQGNTIVIQDKPSPTMRAEHHGNIEFHWNARRRLSAREAARVQTFPDSFIFYPSTSSAYKQIGNAVPPVFAWHVANSISDFLQSIKNE